MIDYIKEELGKWFKSRFSMKYVKNALYLMFLCFSDPYWLHGCYFVGISILGWLALWLSATKATGHLNPLNALYTSVSAATVTSLGAVRMQEFSEFQLLVLIILMLLGGEVYTSMLFLHLRRFNYARHSRKLGHSTNTIEISEGGLEQNWEIGMSSKKMSMRKQQFNDQKKNELVFAWKGNYSEDDLEYRALTSLGYISLIYLLIVQLAGIILIAVYFSISSSGEQTLRSRGIGVSIFGVFTVVSSFANCGFTPLDDDMLPFRKHSILLIIVAFQILLGNTIFPPCFRALIYTLHRCTRDEGRKRTYDYILKHGSRLYDLWFSTTYCLWLVFTTLGFLTVGVTLTLALQWDSEALDGLTTWEKLVGGAFQSLAIRFTGENAVNPELLSTTLIVLYVSMMYLSPNSIYVAHGDVTSIIRSLKTVEEPKSSVQTNSTNLAFHQESKASQFEKLFLHDSSYLIIAVVLICITERDKLSRDPLNFNVLNIVFEVVSAYGNVGMSVRYSCDLFSKMSKGHCQEVFYSFSGKWSAKGKIIIIMVMLFGRLKRIKRHSAPAFTIRHLSMQKLVPPGWLSENLEFASQKGYK